MRSVLSGDVVKTLLLMSILGFSYILIESELCLIVLKLSLILGFKYWNPWVGRSYKERFYLYTRKITREFAVTS